MDLIKELVNLFVYSLMPVKLVWKGSENNLNDLIKYSTYSYAKKRGDNLRQCRVICFNYWIASFRTNGLE